MPDYDHLEPRCREMLMLIAYSKGYVKAREIAEQMRISKRSVYYDIEKINDWLKEQGMPELLQDRQKGIRLAPDLADKIQKVLFGSKSGRRRVLTPGEREQLIIILTILELRQMTTDIFMEVCDVSRNTIVSDIKQVVLSLGKQKLKFVYRAGMGYRVLGDTIRKRAVFFLYYPRFRDYLLDIFFSQDEADSIEHNLSILRNIEKELQAEYVEDILPTMAAFLTSFPRHDSVRLIKVDREEICASKEFMLIKEAYPGLSEEEKIYTALHLLGSRLQTEPVHMSSDRKKAELVAQKLISCFEETSGVLYGKRYPELLAALTNHLTTSMYRYQYGIQLGNPLLESVMTEYRELFDVTKNAFQSAVDQIGLQISDAEIAFLTLHFGAFLATGTGEHEGYRIMVICPNGIGTGNMIRHEVERLVPHAAEVRNIPLRDYKPDHGYDAVVSTVPLENEKKLILVHPILSDSDRIAILRNCMHAEPFPRAEIRDICEIAARYIPEGQMEAFRKDLEAYYSGKKVVDTPDKDYGPGLGHYLKPSHIRIIIEPMSWEKAIVESLHALLLEGSITKQYIDAVVDAQKNRQQYMFLTDHLVLAHSGPDRGVMKSDFAMTVFSHPVLFGNGKTADIIIAMAAEDQSGHIHALNDIIALFSRKKIVESIKMLSEPKEISGYIKEKLSENHVR